MAKNCQIFQQIRLQLSPIYCAKLNIKHPQVNTVIEIHLTVVFIKLMDDAILCQEIGFPDLG